MHDEGEEFELFAVSLPGHSDEFTALCATGG
jgi:hypothetical protein